MAHSCSCDPGARAAGDIRLDITGSTRVGEVASRLPAAPGVLRAFGIDHCCSGHLGLAEATAAAGVELDTLLRALEEVR
jgi:iron-sulfur cluster repair protein YtfE (RIC family)